MKWPSPPEDLELIDTCIDVWRSDIELSKSEIESYYESLSDEEKTRAGLFTFPDKRKEFIVTRGLLRAALACLTKVPAKSFEFSYSKDKKPFLNSTEWKGLAFNVSHSHGQALVALTRNRQLGIDIEYIRKDVDFNKLAKRFFSENEYKALLDYEGETVRAFFSTWTRKEAFVKAIGKGIAFGLAEFDVNVDPDAPAELLATRWQAEDAQKWRLGSLVCVENYAATVAADGAEFALRYWQFDGD